MSDLQLTVRQVGYTNRAFWRNPASAFFTFAFPLMFLVIFTSLLGNGNVELGGMLIKQSTYYVAGMAAFSVISACYTNRSEEHTSELQSRLPLVCRLLLEKK